ncbi:MAG: hypothetical protein K2X32_11710, partial [Phycisphaerales bacterium]|nr:hypothetical protein [Phycisphaerales bacterium]
EIRKAMAGGNGAQAGAGGAGGVGGEERAWLSRAVVDFGRIRQSIPTLFAPGTPPGILFGGVQRVRWGAWAESGGANAAPAGGVVGEKVGQVHMYLRMELNPPRVPKP